MGASELREATMLYRISKVIFVALAILIPVIILTACDDGPTKPDGDYPTYPTNPSPANLAQDRPLNAILSWTGIDPDRLEYYTVYLGLDSTPPQVADHVTDTTFDPVILLPNTTYYWRVYAHQDPVRDPDVLTVWSFTTKPGFVYPLINGAEWNYNVSTWYENVEPDSIAYMFADTLTATSTVRVTGQDTLFDSVAVYVFHEEFVQSEGGSFTSDAYFNETAAGFFYYGATGGNYAAPLKPTAGISYTFNGQTFSSPGELFASVQSGFPFGLASGTQDDLYNPGLMSLAYPLRYGSLWEYRSAGEPFEIHKGISDWSVVTTPAGNFECFKVCWIYGDDAPADNVQFYDYISQDGLVHRSISLDSVSLTSEGSPEYIGTATFVQDILLMSHNIDHATD